MQTFVRMSKLSDIVGRSDYISNPERQEDIVAAKCYADWKQYQAYERKHQRSNTPNNEGRELIIALPNEWKKFDDLNMTSHMNDLAQRLLPGKYDYQWAVHWNKSLTNLHVHLIFSERNRQYNGKEVWDRDIYLTQDGKVARRKADRAVDKNGNIKPPVHRKGEPKNQTFTPKDTKFKSKAWLEQAKNTVTEYFKYYREPVEEYGLLHQYHEGKGKQAAEIHEKNRKIKYVNHFFERLKRVGFVFPENDPEKYNQLKAEIVKNNFRSMIAPFKKIAEYSPELLSVTLKDKQKTTTLEKLMEESNIYSLYYHDVNKGHMLLFAACHKEKVDQIVQESIKKIAPTAPSPSPQQPKPTLNVPRLTSLYQDCIRKVGIYDYIQRHHIDTTAMEAYEKAQKVLDEYSAAAHGYHVLDDQYQSMHNPIKKLKMRPAIKEAAERLGSAAKKLSSTFGISLIIDGEEFDSSVATRNETSALRMRTTERMQRLSEAASEERRQNEEIKSMKLQNIDKESYNKAIVALQRECEDISIAESKAALRALQAAEIPILSFETGDTRSGAKMAVYDFAERILKKKISQAENEAEISPKKVVEAKKEEPEQETYRPTYGRSR